MKSGRDLQNIHGSHDLHIYSKDTRERDSPVIISSLRCFFIEEGVLCLETEQLLKLLRMSYNHNLYDRFDAIFTKELFS